MALLLPRLRGPPTRQPGAAGGPTASALFRSRGSGSGRLGRTRLGRLIRRRNKIDLAPPEDVVAHSRQSLEVPRPPLAEMPLHARRTVGQAGEKTEQLERRFVIDGGGTRRTAWVIMGRGTIFSRGNGRMEMDCTRWKNARRRTGQ